MQQCSTMPTPADIFKIITPPVQKQEWCKVTFLEIKRKKRENVFTTRAEDKYVEDFMAAKVSATGDSQGVIDEVLSRAAIEDKRYWGD